MIDIFRKHPKKTGCFDLLSIFALHICRISYVQKKNIHLRTLFKESFWNLFEICSYMYLSERAVLSRDVNTQSNIVRSNTIGCMKMFRAYARRNNSFIYSPLLEHRESPRSILSLTCTNIRTNYHRARN